ncbi:MAG: hypothetical protein CNE89_10675 [Sphingomonadaceae bacterium MED-G03]|nr:MAG: hypothetical protein CNE89_10675 [Sphingomonadaceae bacterium MED-G03]
MLDRRGFIGAASGIAATLAVPRIAYAARAPTDRRFVLLIQRGAADGLHILAPTGDPAFAAQRSAFADKLEGGLVLGSSFFTLHPALVRIGQMAEQKQARFVHATASAYRDRSHFDGQNVLESGGLRPYAEKTGWMNRLLTQLPGARDRGLAIAPAIPMALRGPAQVATYAPSALQDASDDLMARVSALYADDPQLAPLWQSALATQKLAGDIAGDNGRNAAAIGALAARLLGPREGARVMMIESNGWDTHSGQAPRMAGQLKGVDALVAALADGLGPAWQETLLIVATEFGRTVAINGTGGTDHGTGGLMMLMGGALPGGGQVDADWPGLAPAALLDGRDLRPTIASEAVIGGALAAHFDIDPAQLTAHLYPAQPRLKARLA